MNKHVRVQTKEQAERSRVQSKEQASRKVQSRGSKQAASGFAFFIFRITMVFSKNRHKFYKT